MVEGQTLLEYLQYLAGLDTNEEGSIVEIGIAVHPMYDLVVLPRTEEAAYFQTTTRGKIRINETYRVPPPEED